MFLTLAEYSVAYFKFCRESEIFFRGPFLLCAFFIIDNAIYSVAVSTALSLVVASFLYFIYDIHNFLEHLALNGISSGNWHLRESIVDFALCIGQMFITSFIFLSVFGRLLTVATITTEAFNLSVGAYYVYSRQICQSGFPLLYSYFRRSVQDGVFSNISILLARKDVALILSLGFAANSLVYVYSIGPFFALMYAGISCFKILESIQFFIDYPGQGTSGKYFVSVLRNSNIVAITLAWTVAFTLSLFYCVTSIPSVFIFDSLLPITNGVVAQSLMSYSSLSLFVSGAITLLESLRFLDRRSSHTYLINRNKCKKAYKINFLKPEPTAAVGSKTVINGLTNTLSSGPVVGRGF